MSNSLLDIIKGMITPEIISQAASALGVSNEGVTKGVGAIVPTLLGGLLNQSGNADTMNSVAGLLKDNSGAGGALSGDLLGSVGSLLGGDAASSPLGMIGTQLLGSLFGDKLSGVSTLLGTVTGLKGGAVGSLLTLIAPFLLKGIAGKLGGNIAGPALASLIGGEKSSILGALPMGLGSLLGGGLGDMLSSVTGAAGNVAKGATDVVSGTAKAATGAVTDTAKAATDLVGAGTGSKMLWPAIIGGIALAGLLAYAFLNKPADQLASPSQEMGISATPDAPAATPEAPTATPETTTATPESPAVVPAGTLPVADSSVKLPGDIELKAAKGGIEEQWVAFIQSADPVSKDKWFNFDRVLFDTGKATLRPESNDQIENAAKVLKAFPNVKIKIGGYTDNVGDDTSNMKLSQARADAMKAAIEKAGAPAGSIEKAEGYGEGNPIASNDTKEGQQQNRRIAIRVTAK
jgi:OmpA-OmpF porin, OOP family